jgi:hypothetical protein
VWTERRVTAAIGQRDPCVGCFRNRCFAFAAETCVVILLKHEIMSFLKFGVRGLLSQPLCCLCYRKRFSVVAAAEHYARF